MNQTNQVFIITLSIITLGFLIKKFNYISEQEGKIISKFLMHSTFPALMFLSTARIKFDSKILQIPFYPILLGLSMLAVGWFWFRKYPNQLRGVLTMGLGGFNTGLFGFPIIEGLFGKEAMIYAIMFDIGNTFIVFGVIYSIGNYFSASKSEQNTFFSILKKIITLPPVLALLLGICVSILAIPLPPTFVDFLDILAKANKPLVLLLMGIYLSFELNKRTMQAISQVLMIRYAIGLVVVFGIYRFFPVATLTRNVLMLCTLLPIGLTILPFSDQQGYDSRIAGTMLNISLLISFGLMWGLVLFLGI